MNLYIKWRYPGDEEIHEKVHYDIDPTTICISGGMLGFSEKPSEVSTWKYPLSHVVDMSFRGEKRVYEVGYHVGDGIFSVNMVEGDEITSEQYAKAHAKKYGYELAYIIPISASKAEENKAKGMPLIKA